MYGVIEGHTSGVEGADNLKCTRINRSFSSIFAEKSAADLLYNIGVFRKTAIICPITANYFKPTNPKETPRLFYKK
jgi:hypothetical protein